MSLCVIKFDLIVIQETYSYIVTRFNLTMSLPDFIPEILEILIM